MSTTRIEGTSTYAQPLDNGRTRYRVTIEFSNDYEAADALDTNHPSRWGWVDLLDEPDARIVSWVEDLNPGWLPPCPTCSRPVDPGDCIPCESCGGRVCPQCETEPCPGRGHNE